MWQPSTAPTSTRTMPLLSPGWEVGRSLLDDVSNNDDPIVYGRNCIPVGVLTRKKADANACLPLLCRYSGTASTLGRAPLETPTV